MAETLNYFRLSKEDTRGRSDMKGDMSHSKDPPIGFL